ncbi:MAG: DUF2442 domain-containing protein [candidate division KSB1 bacterium]
MSAAKSKIKIYREPVDESAQNFIDLVRAEYLEGYKIHLWFSDGKDHVVDFGPFLQAARNPMSTRYREVGAFQQFRVENGNLNWNDYEMCFDLEDLYLNNLELELDNEARNRLETIARQFKLL